MCVYVYYRSINFIGLRACALGWHRKNKNYGNMDTRGVPKKIKMLLKIIFNLKSISQIFLDQYLALVDIFAWPLLVLKSDSFTLVKVKK